MRVDNHDAIDTIWLQSLLDHILDDGLVEHRQKLLGEGLRGGEEAGAEARSGNDCFHVDGPFFSRRSAPAPEKSFKPYPKSAGDNRRPRRAVVSSISSRAVSRERHRSGYGIVTPCRSR